MAVASDTSVRGLIGGALNVFDVQRAVLDALSHVCRQPNVFPFPGDCFDRISGYRAFDCQRFARNR